MSSSSGATHPLAAPTIAGVSAADASTRSLADNVGPGWADALAPVADVIAQLGDFLRAERAARRPFFPAAGNILRALQQPLDAVRVLIVGQDPYPTAGHPVGLSFSNIDRKSTSAPRLRC
jgi:uracil-DNA glycosylase